MLHEGEILFTYPGSVARGAAALMVCNEASFDRAQSCGPCADA